MARLCLSGDVDCSGIAPCDACEKALYERVLPRAMIAGGFNGSVTVAQKFFEGFKSAHDELKEKAPQEIVAVIEEPEEKEEKEPEESEPESLTEDEISTMGRIEDFVEDEGEGEEPEHRSPSKSARAMARMARRLKQKRAGKKNHTSKKDEEHGKEQQAGGHGDEGELRAGEVPPGGVQPR